MGQKLSDKEKTARLRLIRTDGVGPITYHHIMRNYGSASVALEALPDLAAKGGRKKTLKPPSAGSLGLEVAKVKALGGQFIFHGDDTYPAQLGAIEDAPPVLGALGHLHLLTKPMIGMVGARNASASGLKMTERLATRLGEAGYVIVSGLARGIDTAAHKASLTTGTVACIAGGLDVVYPKENAALSDAIAKQGVILSEMPLGTQPQARHFPRRNRLISGLSLGVAVIEAAAKSGSLITARQALDQGRDVFAVPGSPLDPRSDGANQLIRDGAVLVRDGDDILDALTLLNRISVSDPGYQPPETRVGAPPVIDDALVAQLLDLLSPAPVAVDDLIRQVDEPAGAVQAALIALELGGKAERHTGGMVSRK